MTDTLLNNALLAWEWLANPSNSEPLEPLKSDGNSTEPITGEALVGDAFVPMDARRFSPNALHKQKFGRLTKADVHKALHLLEESGVVGILFTEATGGRPKSFRHISGDWLCADNIDAFEKKKTKLTELLTQVLCMNQSNDYVANKTQNAATEDQSAVENVDEKPSTNQIFELAIQVFDWFADLENHEMDNRSQRFFSVERLRRAIEVDQAELDHALNVLEHRVSVIGARQQDLRGRQIRYIRPEWLGRGFGRRRLLEILKPEPPKPYVPFGPARVLRTAHVYVGGQLMTFNEGDIVRDEFQVSALLKAEGMIAKLDEVDARACAKCRHRFALTESAPIDYPILEAIRRDIITYPDSTTLTLKPGDVLTDRSQCLRLTTAMPDRIKDTLRVLPPDAYMMCPKCKHVSKNNADLQLAKK